MKNLYRILLFVMLLPFCVAGQQNHVPNGSFEYYTTCPTSHSQFPTPPWYSYTISVDYFNTCNSSNWANIPSNFRGYQYAADGNGYIGFGTYDSLFPMSRECAATPIIPLQVGTLYEVSYSISLCDNYTPGHDGFGAIFFKNGPTTVANGAMPPFTPQINYNTNPIIDTANWTRLSDVFLADSTYDKLIIGSFKPDSTRNFSYTNSPKFTGGSIYYFDSVVVKAIDSLFIVDLQDTLLCGGDTIDIDYYSYFKKQSNNVFTIQLSNASGSFASPVNIGSVSSDTSGPIIVVIPANTATGNGYKMRVVASNFGDTSEESITIKIGYGPINKPVVSNNGPVCNNDVLNLAATSSTSGVTYKWTGPSSFTSNVQNPSINNPLPANSGNYIVTAYLYGCEAKDTTAVTVHAGSGPSGTNATTNTPICADDTLKLFGTANGSGNNYSWTGPNSFNSSQQNPVIPFASGAASGNYILYAYNANCTSLDTVVVLVKPLPANYSTTSNSPICNGATINFTTSSTSTGVTYTWAGPNGFNSTSATPFINGSSIVHNGNYYVTATLNGCSLSNTLPVTVKPLPIKPVATGNTPLCAGGSLNLTVGNSAGSSFGWTGPVSFTSSTQNPNISNTTTAMSGEYIVTIGSNGCINKDTATVLVKPLPTAVTASNNTPLCAGDTLKILSTASSTGATYTWTGPGSYTSTTLNSTIANLTSTMTGWYKMSVDLNGCTTEDSTNAIIHAIPQTPSITFSNPLCIGETLNLNASAVNGATYSWTGANNFTSNLQNPSRANMQFGDTGSYTVNATANGCTSPSGTVKVNLNANPFVVIFANPADSICQGDPVVFTALPNNHGGTPSYIWTVNTQMAGTGAVFNTTTLNDGDVIVCEMTENTKCSVPYKDESNDIQMTVLPWLAPSVTITASPNHPLDEYEYVSFTAVATNAGKNPTYQWKRNGQPQQGATSNVWSANTLNDNDSVSVEVFSDYECPQPTSAISNWIRIRTTGVTDLDGFGELVLYPNPNRGKFVLKATSPGLSKGEEVSLQVLNTLGQVVYSDNIATGNGVLHKEIDLGNVASGVYLLRIKSDDGKVASMRFRVE